jgi:hypothetical protein
MSQIRIDMYGGYVGEPKPDPDMRFSFKQEKDETPQDYSERLIEHVTSLVGELADVDDEEDE